MDLYALPPEEFTAARTAQVKAARAAGDRDLAARLGALRRPTASAYAVNALVRAEPELVAQVVALGAQLGQAQGGGDAAALRALGEQRRQLLEAVTDRAAEAVGGALSPTARLEVTGTLEAALADPASAEAVRSGRLVRALSYAGFGGADLEGAVAEPTGAATEVRHRRPRARTTPRIPGAALPGGGGPGGRAGAYGGGGGGRARRRGGAGRRGPRRRAGRAGARGGAVAARAGGAAGHDGGAGAAGRAGRPRRRGRAGPPGRAGG